jgi:hypothetical protein
MKPSSMLEKLTAEYELCQEWGLTGKAVGYFRDIPEKIPSHYEFPHGIFTLRRKENDFFMWHYDAK